jgi:uncharacterized protein with HEPN domain
MNRKIASRLLDAINALDEVEAFTSGLSESDFEAQRGTQLIVERLLITVGESIGRAEEIDSEIAKRIPEIRDIVGTRNRLVHGYWEVSAKTLWEVIVEKGPQLRETLQDLLEEYG